MKKILTSLSLCAALFMLGSCEKDDPHYDDMDVSKIKMLSHDYWILEDYTVNLDIEDEFSVATSIFDEIASCTLDDFFEFTMDHEMIRHEGYTKCSVNDPDSTISYFILSEAVTKIAMYYNEDRSGDSKIFEGNIYYPDIKHFYWQYKVYNASTEKVEEHTRYFKVKYDYDLE